MTYEEIVEKAREDAKKVDASNIKEHLAYQINIEGEGEGAFYIEVKDGVIDIEPYEYYDRDAIIITDADTILEIMEGKKNPVKAFLNKEIRVEGDLGKAAMLEKVLSKIAS